MSSSTQKEIMSDVYQLEHGNSLPASRPITTKTDLDTTVGVTTGELSTEHQEFLVQRHGTTNLDPIPSMDLADPFNWPAWKKNSNLLVVASLSFMTTFMAAGISPAFSLLAKDLNVTVTAATYLTSSQIAAHGFAPLFWRPISNHYGRRPVWMISTLGSCLFNIGCANSHTYASQQVCRIFTTLFISSSVGIGSVVVAETFFSQQRATKIGFWTLGTTLGPFFGPFLMGFVTYRIGSWEWIYWIFAIVNGFQFILVLFLCPETRFAPHELPEAKRSTFHKEYMNFRAITSQPIALAEFFSPLKLFGSLDILIPIVACAIVFNFASVFFTVELPPMFARRFHFNPEQSGLQFAGLIIGSGLGELIGGPLSDFWMARQARSLGQKPPQEYRLWLSYIGFSVAMAGFLVFGIQTNNIGEHYNVTPIIGTAMAGFGNQLITTVLVTYAVDSNPGHAASVGSFFNVVRSTWGWLGPFWFPKMVASIGLAGSGGLMAGLVFVVSVIPIMWLHWRGSKIREARAVREDGMSKVMTSRV